MTAIAARLLEAQGAYRSPSESGFLFLLYDRLEQIPATEMARYMPLKRPENENNRVVERSWLMRIKQCISRWFVNRNVTK
jgi:hypothetical protein